MVRSFSAPHGSAVKVERSTSRQPARDSQRTSLTEAALDAAALLDVDTPPHVRVEGADELQSVLGDGKGGGGHVACLNRPGVEVE